MRGWKPISFEQFKNICVHVAINAWGTGEDMCDDDGPYSGCDCCATFCRPWRKLGRADIKVIKISTPNKAKGKINLAPIACKEYRSLKHTDLTCMNGCDD